MRIELYSPMEEAEGRLLILVNAFSKTGRCLEGRTKLAKLDFFLRYPRYLKRALEIRKVGARTLEKIDDAPDVESRMVRYRYGPWDPAYFVLLGRLIGKGLIEPVPYKQGIGYRSTPQGCEFAISLAETDAWAPIEERAEALRKNLDLTGTWLMNFVYANFPEVSSADWGVQL